RRPSRKLSMCFLPSLTMNALVFSYVVSAFRRTVKVRLKPDTTYFMSWVLMLPGEPDHAAVDRRQIRRADERHGDGELRGGQLDHPLHADRAARRDAPRRRPPEQDGLGAQRERFQDVDAAAD